MDSVRWTVVLSLIVAGVLATTGAAQVTGSPGAEGGLEVAPPAAEGDHASVRVDDHATVVDGTYYVWASDEVELAVRVGDPSDEDAENAGTYDVCVDFTGGDGGGGVAPDCEDTRRRTNAADDRELSWHVDLSGEAPRRLTARVSVERLDCEEDCERTASETLTVSVVVIERSGDLDGDGLSNEAELNAGTALDGSDTDGDGLSDGAELNEYGTDPNAEDTDGDGTDDGADVERTSDPDDADSTDPDGAENTRTSTSDESTRDDRGSDDRPTRQSDRSGGAGDQRTGGSSDGVERGFFTNDTSSPLYLVSHPMNITTIGFVLSVIGITLELRRGL